MQGIIAALRSAVGAHGATPPPAVRLIDSGIPLGRVGLTDRSPDLSELDRNRNRTCVQKCVDTDFEIVDSKYAVSDDAKFELLHGRARDRTGDDMDEHKVADGVYLTRKRKANLQMPEVQSRDQLIRIERQMDQYIHADCIVRHEHQAAVGSSGEARRSHGS